MYVEQKTSGPRLLSDRGPAEIGEVTFSQTGKTIYYGGKTFARLKGGRIGNYYCVETGDEYRISGVKKKGTNRHWAGGGPVTRTDGA